MHAHTHKHRHTSCHFSLWVEILKLIFLPLCDTGKGREKENKAGAVVWMDRPQHRVAVEGDRMVKGVHAHFNFKLLPQSVPQSIIFSPPSSSFPTAASETQDWMSQTQRCDEKDQGPDPQKWSTVVRHNFHNLCIKTYKVLLC